MNIEKDGKEFEKKVITPKGGLENPMTESELVEKFTELAAPVIRDKHTIPKIVDLILNLEKLESFTKITSLLYKTC